MVMVERQTKYFVGAVVAAALIAAALVARAQLGFDEDSLQAAGVFALLGILAHVMAYRIPRGAMGNISFVPFMSAVAVAPGLSVVISVTLAVALAEILQRRDRLKGLFNLGQYALSVSVAILVFRALGGRPIDAASLHSKVAFAAAFTSFFLVNTVCVSAVIAISTHQRLAGVLWQNTHSALIYDVIAVPAVYGFAFLYAKLGPAWSVVFAIPLFGLRHFYKTNWQLERLNEELLQIMVAAIEARDPYTSGHSQRVAEYVRIVARAAGLGTRAVERLATAALLHDVGKIHEEFAPILRKPGRLTQAEFAVMKTHSAKGAVLVGKSSQFHDLVSAIRGHHEAWDGSGYPDGLVGDKIPQWSRFIAIADTIDAMATTRPYRDALSYEVIRSEIMKESGRQFDPAICVKLLNASHWPALETAIARNALPRDVSAGAEQVEEHLHEVVAELQSTQRPQPVAL